MFVVGNDNMVGFITPGDRLAYLQLATRVNSTVKWSGEGIFHSFVLVNLNGILKYPYNIK